MSKPRILLADDSITIQKVVNLTFADHGMDVVTFPDGDSAIENFDAVKPDIVLADVHMPGMNGYQICELVRSDAVNSKIPVVLLVGSFEPYDREEAERVGASAHLTKPFSSIAELVSTVNRLLAEPEASNEPGQDELPTAESAPEASPPAEPGPDTSDIESLYQQSFVETVEIPKNDGDAEFEFEPMDLDDEMIQTSYAGDHIAAEPEHEISELYTVAEEVGPDHGDEAPASHSDESEEAAGPVVEMEPPTTEPTPIEASREDIEEEAAPSVPVSDPFESPAPDLPPPSVETGSSEDTARFSFDDSDLLEIPSFGQRQPGPASQFGPSEITSLSPELIELIVDKVVERLAQRNELGNVSSNTGS